MYSHATVNIMHDVLGKSAHNYQVDDVHQTVTIPGGIQKEITESVKVTNVSGSPSSKHASVVNSLSSRGTLEFPT